MGELPFPGCRWKRRWLGEGIKERMGEERLGEENGGGCAHDAKQNKTNKTKSDIFLGKHNVPRTNLVLLM